MAYTIKGLAKANEREQSAYGLADQWLYWYTCNYGGRKTIITDFKRLRKADRKEMLGFLRSEPSYAEVYNHIIENII